MPEEAVGLLCLLVVVLAVVTVVGHVIWLVLEALLRAMSGSQVQPRCPRCQSGAFFDGRCPHCGYPGEVKLRPADEIKAAARQLRRLFDQSKISEEQYEAILNQLKGELDALQQPPARPVTQLPPRLVYPPAASAPAATTAPAAGLGSPFATEKEVVEAMLVDSPEGPLLVPTPAGPSAPAAVHPLDRPVPPAPPPTPSRPARSLADILSSFMEESNIRGGEILAGLLIVVSAVGLVISLRATLKNIPYFPALLFTVFTVAFHGAGLYTLRRWKLHAVSRVVLIISLLLVPLTFSAAVVLSGSGEQQRPVTDPLFLMALAGGLLIFIWVSYSAAKELVGSTAWRLAAAVLGCSVSQVLIQRANLPVLNWPRLLAVAAIPLACFMLAIVGQVLRGRRWPQISRRRSEQALLVLGISSFALLAPVLLIIFRSGDIWLTLARLSPLLSLAASCVLVSGFQLHRRATSKSAIYFRTAGTAVAIFGGLLMLVMLALAWPRPEILLVAGLVNAAILAGLAQPARLPLLYGPAIGCAALAALMAMHLQQGTLLPWTATNLPLIEALLMGRSALLLMILAAAAIGGGIWFHLRPEADTAKVLLTSGGTLAALSLAIAAFSGFVSIDGWRQDPDLASPLFLMAAIGLLIAAPRLPTSLPAAIGAVFLWAGLVQALAFNETIRVTLAGMTLLPMRPILVATLLHAVTVAVLAFVCAGSAVLAPPKVFADAISTPRWQRLVDPLVECATAVLIVLSPLIVWVWHGHYRWHAAYAFAAAIAWALITFARRRPSTMMWLQATWAAGLALLIAALWQGTRQPSWQFAAAHLNSQTIALSGMAAFWAVARRLSTGRPILDRLLGTFRPGVDQFLLGLAVVGILYLASSEAILHAAWELGFALPAAPAGPVTSTLVLWWGVAALAAALFALVASLVERVTWPALVGVGLASAAAIGIAALGGQSDIAAASTARWAAGIYTLVWGLVFIFRDRLRRVAKSQPWLRWAKLPDQWRVWLCIQPLLLGGAVVLVLTLIAVAQSVEGVALRGPAANSVFAFIGPTASYAGPLGMIVAVLLGYAVRERQGGFALGASATFQLAVNLAFMLHVAYSPDQPGAVRLAEWLQWNTVGAASFGVLWAGLFRWIARPGRPAEPALANLNLDQSLLSLQLAVALLAAGWLAAITALAIAQYPAVPPAEVATLGQPLSYIALALTLALAVAWWYCCGRDTPATIDFLPDFVFWLSAALVPIIAATANRWDPAGTWISFHTLTGGWIVVAALGCTAIAIPWKVRLTTPYHLSVAALCGLIVALAIVGNVADPAQPWWSLSACAGAMVMISALGVTQRSQPYAYVSTLLAGLCVILFWAAPKTLPWITFAFGRSGGMLEVLALSLLIAAAFWLSQEVSSQRDRGQSLDPRYLMPRAHSLVVLGLMVPYLLLHLLYALAEGSVIAFRGHEAAACIATLAYGGVIAGCLWDRRAHYTLPAAWVWGIIGWLVAIDATPALEQNPFRAMTALVVAGALHIAVTGQVWFLGANIAALGNRLGVPDPVGGLTRTSRWLPGVNSLATAGLCVAALSLILWLPQLQLRIFAALVPGIAGWGIACLAQQQRREAMQLSALLLAGLSVCYLGWAQLDPTLTAQFWLTRVFRLVMALSALTFIYGLGLPRLLFIKGDWYTAARRAGYFAAIAAVAAFIANLTMEIALFRPGIGAPVEIQQVIAIAAILFLLIAGLLSLALMPGADPMVLTERGKQGYVYAAEAIAALLFAHLYVCRPMWFDTFLRLHWPLIVMGIAFVGVGAAELSQRLKIRVLAEPLHRTAAMLPLLPVLGMWVTTIHSTDYALLLLVVGLLYLVLSVTQKSWVSLVGAALAGNAALWVMLHRDQYYFAANPQFWLVPPAVSVLAAAQIHRHRLDPRVLTGIRYAAAGLIYLSSTSEIFIRGVGSHLWPPMVLAVLSVAGALLGIMLRIRAFLYLGTAFTLMALITMVAHAAQSIDHVWPWWALGIGMGIAILILFGIFEKQRDQVMALIARLKQWEQ